MAVVHRYKVSKNRTDGNGHITPIQIGATELLSFSYRSCGVDLLLRSLSSGMVNIEGNCPTPLETDRVLAVIPVLQVKDA